MSCFTMLLLLAAVGRMSPQSMPQAIWTVGKEAYFSISMHAYGSVPIIMVLSLD